MTFAPVAIFAFHRPDHLRKTIAALRTCPEFQRSLIYVYCDGPRNDADRQSVMATRDIARGMLADLNATFIERDQNCGLANSIIAGVSELCEKFGRVIVIEDDLLVSPGFLAFMNRALDRYAENERVDQVSGFNFEVPELRGNPSALFLPFTVSWGWATWKRAWEKFDPSSQGWETLRNDADLRHRFNMNGSYDYATMLEQQMKGLRDSWAVRWYWTVFKANGLGLFPPVTLVTNTGFDGSGTHGRGLLRQFDIPGAPLVSKHISLPDSVLVDEIQYRHVCRALWRQNGGWAGTLVDRMRRMFA